MPDRTDSNWIQTFTGRQFWPLNPRAEDVCIEDIAHALSMKCRYTGHTREFYSVAQHSVLASRCCKDSRWGLMHDATEAYLPDVARPVKRALGTFTAIEDALMRVIAPVFELEMPIPECVHQVDLVLLATERRDLMAEPPVPWITTEQIKPLEMEITPWEPYEAKELFLRCFFALFGALEY
ncbi:hypothetical protein LCGC14_0839670 [marine sediment metagenome]|uniref:HD domain-containing protein n=1 Tax=marine sediment metagenome TaxID=412755 RepID=A0A0F9PIA7_9ZZZZ